MVLIARKPGPPRKKAAPNPRVEREESAEEAAQDLNLLGAEELAAEDGEVPLPMLSLTQLFNYLTI